MDLAIVIMGRGQSICIVRLFLAMAAIHHWPLHQLNIKSVFLLGDLGEEIYMEQPLGFVALGEEIYMKQSPVARFYKLNHTIQAFGWK